MGIFATSKRIVGVRASPWFIVLLLVSFLGTLGILSGIAVITHAYSPEFAIYGGFAMTGALIAWGQKRLQKKDSKID